MTTRRDFITTVATTAAGLTIVPRHVLGRGFQAPSDPVNVAAVGINGMGAVEHPGRDEPEHRRDLRLRSRPARRQARASGRKARAGAPPQPQHPPARRRSPATSSAASSSADRRRRSAPPTRKWPDQDGRANLQRFVERADPAPEEVPGLPRDAREAEGHRRGHRRHARSHARRDRVERDGRRQARLRAEAAVLVGARGAAPGEEGEGEEGRRADGQPAALGRREPPRRSNTSRAARSATSTRCTSGPNRPLGCWPQGVPRPAAAPSTPRDSQLGRPRR